MKYFRATQLQRIWFWLVLLALAPGVISSPGPAHAAGAISFAAFLYFAPIVAYQHLVLPISSKMQKTATETDGGLF